jgi:protein-S-isoprenylcysteine O-methyltransferase Ste14
MELYGRKSKSIPQKTVIILVEILLLILSYWLMFMGGGKWLFGFVGWEYATESLENKIIIQVFSIIVFLRITFMMLYLLKRTIPWEESISVPIAFSLYFIGFPLLAYHRNTPIGWLDYIAIGIFVLGSFLNTCSELQRHFWKKKPENKGKIYSEGLFKYSMHINYFGDVLWVIGYALVTQNIWAISIPAFLFCFFAFYNIPMLDKYLAERYQQQFDEYAAKTKKFVPFIW